MKHEEFDSLLLRHDDAACYITDYDTYELLHLTRGSMKVLGIHSHKEYEGKKCYQVLMGLDAPCPSCTNKKLVPGKKYHWENYNEKLGRWLAIEDLLVEVEGRRYRLEHAVDITGQRQKLQRLSDQLTVEQVLVKCLQTLAGVDDYQLAFRSFLEQLGRYYRAGRANIYELDLEDQLLNRTYTWSAPHMGAEQVQRVSIPLEYVYNWLTNAERTEGAFVSITAADSRLTEDVQQFLAGQGVQSLLAAPLYAEGDVIGLISVDNPTSSVDDLTLLRASSAFVVEELKKRRLIRRLKHVSYTDLLTGLQNRNSYMEALKRCEARPPHSLGVVFADVNGMKAVNDTQGHRSGDRLLVHVSDLLRQVTGGRCFRIGGDEFVMLFENISRADFDRKTAQLKALAGQDEGCGLSIGCVWEEGDIDVNRQLIHADELMYAEKQSYYRTVLSEGQARRAGIVSEVANEIAAHRFAVFYQPQYDRQFGRLTGATALVRKRNDSGGLLPPGSFLLRYESEGVIRHVNLFVLETVCAAMQAWQQAGYRLCLTVSFSCVTMLEPDIVGEIAAVCTAHEVSPENLAVVVTESIGYMDYERLHDRIAALRAHGFAAALEDDVSPAADGVLLGRIVSPEGFDALLRTSAALPYAQ